MNNNVTDFPKRSLVDQDDFPSVGDNFVARKNYLGLLQNWSSKRRGLLPFEFFELDAREAECRYLRFEHRYLKESVDRLDKRCAELSDVEKENDDLKKIISDLIGKLEGFEKR